MTGINFLPKRDGETISRLLDIWESAVRKTHAFLSEHDIAQIKPEVAKALAAIENVYGYRDDDGIVQGFIGVADCKVEMLFIDGRARGKGIGKQLLRYAVDALDAKFVDVNEQNEQGVGFYIHMGFHVLGRSEQDAQGRNFPLLHLGLPDKGLPDKTLRNGNIMNPLFPCTGAPMSTNNRESEVKKASFWISQLVVIIATVSGVYLAASQGLEQAIQFDEITSEQDNYFLRKSLQNELADNVGYIREYADKVKKQIANPELALETFVWNSMTYSPAALETPSELLREAQRFYHAAAAVMANKNFQPRNRAENLAKLADHVEANVLPAFEANTASLRAALQKRGISFE